MLTPLYQYKLVSSGNLPFVLPPKEKIPILKLLLVALLEWNENFETIPVVERMDHATEVLLVFPDSMVVCGEFLDSYQELLAVISTVYPVEVLGSTPKRENGKLSVYIEQNTPHWCKENASGRDFDTIARLCIRFSAPDLEQADFLETLLRNFDYRQHCVALPFLPNWVEPEWTVQQKNEGSHFYYPSADEEVSGEDRVCCLSLQQKEQLWKIFLIDGLCPAEFDWLLDCFLDNPNFSLLEWELSLQAALQQAGITVNNHDKQFSVTGPNQKPMRFDFTRGCAGEKIFLKILFPF